VKRGRKHAGLALQGSFEVSDQPALVKVWKKGEKAFPRDLLETHPAMQLHPMVPALDLKRFVKNYNSIRRIPLDPRQQRFLPYGFRVFGSSKHNSAF
jgi:hypothetical protein